ncbi:MAG TPA: SIS domain-containing protein [Clostridiaceae bacterium]|nr:SIS domain-containing protein [Clostridiaceae bacterium]
MFKTGYEILNQYEALKKTYDYILGKKKEIKDFQAKTNYKSVTFIGCGSSYCLCKSAEVSYKLRSGMPANSIAAGDLLVNFPAYKKLLENTLLIAPSRSGSTSEVVLSVEMAKAELGVPCISIAAKQETKLGEIADLSIEIPWAFDESVCQTRTVTNLYLADLLLIGIMLDDTSLVEELEQAIKAGEEHINRTREIAREVVDNEEWQKVVVLADAEIAGIAEEGALAFNEICQLPSNYYHILDVRHGPMVLINGKTLALVGCSPDNESYQKDLIKDLKAKGAVVVTVSARDASFWDSDYNVEIPRYKNFAVNGVPFILVPQLLSYFKALKAGVNPDEPTGLDPWIKL